MAMVFAAQGRRRGGRDEREKTAASSVGSAAPRHRPAAPPSFLPTTTHLDQSQRSPDVARRTIQQPWVRLPSAAVERARARNRRADACLPDRRLLASLPLPAFSLRPSSHPTDYQNRVGSKFGGGGPAGNSEANVDRRERLRKLAMETIDLKSVRPAPPSFAARRPPGLPCLPRPLLPRRLTPAVWPLPFPRTRTSCARTWARSSAGCA